MINLMIVEDNKIVRDSLVTFFNMEKDIRIVAEMDDGATALKKLRTGTKIDIVLVDWNMPHMSGGLELTNFIANEFPSIKIIILTMHGKQDYKEKAKAAGARGYILKDGEFDELVAAIRRVFFGEEVFT